MRTIGVVTGARADYGIYRPILQRMQADADLELRLFLTGTHLTSSFGLTSEAIEADGFPIAGRVDMLLASATPEGVAKSVGLGTIGFAQVFAQARPDVLLVLGDRYEMYAAALAALPFNIPVGHVHGGEVTAGAIDDALRHSMTKLSHLHFVSTEAYGRRVVQLGEEPWRVTVCGAPSLDNLQDTRLLSRSELEERCQIELGAPFLLVTFHPVTLAYEQTVWFVDELLGALTSVAMPVVFTLPNADTGHHVITERLREYVAAHPSACLVESLGTQAYFSLMAIAAAMVGNSSSGIVEAASFRLPVVNIGNRQAGRVRGKNVIDVGHERGEIVAGVRQAISESFRASLAGLENPYGRGDAAPRIVDRLKSEPLDDRLLVKVFYDVPPHA